MITNKMDEGTNGVKPVGEEEKESMLSYRARQAVFGVGYAAIAATLIGGAVCLSKYFDNRKQGLDQEIEVTLNSINEVAESDEAPNNEEISQIVTNLYQLQKNNELNFRSEGRIMSSACQLNMLNGFYTPENPNEQRLILDHLGSYASAFSDIKKIEDKASKEINQYFALAGVLGLFAGGCSARRLYRTVVPGERKRKVDVVEVL